MKKLLLLAILSSLLFGADLYYGNVKINTTVDATGGHSLVTSTEQATISDFDLELDRGDILGMTSFSKFGRNPLVDTTTDPEDVWNGGGIYSGFPTGAAETLEIFSSSALDTIAGTGARTVKISGLLDGTGAEMPTVTVDLNGTSPVSLGTQTYYRCSRAEVMTAGTGETNAGTLTIRHSVTTANIFAQLPAGKGKTIIAASTVPLGKTLYLDDLSVSMSRLSGAAGSAEVLLLTRTNGGAWTAQRDRDITNSNSYSHKGRSIVLTERTDFKIQVSTVSDNGTAISAEMNGRMVDN